MAVADVFCLSCLVRFAFNSSEKAKLVGWNTVCSSDVTAHDLECVWAGDVSGAPPEAPKDQKQKSLLVVDGLGSDSSGEDDLSSESDSEGEREGCAEGADVASKGGHKQVDNEVPKEVAKRKEQARAESPEGKRHQRDADRSRYWGFELHAQCFFARAFFLGSQHFEGCCEKVGFQIVIGCVSLLAQRIGVISKYMCTARGWWGCTRLLHIASLPVISCLINS